MEDVRLVRLSKRAQRNLEKVPRHVVVNLMPWVTSVEEVNKHDY